MTRMLAPVLLLFLLVSPQTAAQESPPPPGDERPSSCDLLLHQAEDAYAIGRFREAIDFAANCRKLSTSGEDRIDALALLAKAHLALDENGPAREAIDDLIWFDRAFRPARNDPERFKAMVEEARTPRGDVVYSVSKSAEDLREAPATVYVVTAEEIARRGYTDLEAVLHDLPGFDITRTNGITYSNIYQRGNRSDLTTRTLVLIDGVEENDIWLQAVYLSRQYPLSNIARIEVIYGPASTMYGANAFSGVINILTKTPQSLLTDPDKDHSLRVDLTSGAYGTRIVDALWAGRTAAGNIRWTLSGRLFESNERDLSGFDQWDYDLGRNDASYIGATRLTGERAETFLSGREDCTGRDDCLFAAGTAADGSRFVRLSERGIAEARRYDQRAFDDLGGEPVAFTDETDDYMLSARLFLWDHLELGLRTWRRAEGSNPSGTDLGIGGGPGRLMWVPRSTALYAKFTNRLSHTLELSFNTRFKLHELDAPSSSEVFSGFVNGGRTLDNLLTLSTRDFNTPYDDPRFNNTNCDDNRDADGVIDQARSILPCWDSLYYYLSNNQLRSEISIHYNPSRRFDLVAGTELRLSSIQGNYVLSDIPNPDQNGSPIVLRDDGTPINGGRGGNQFNIRDLGVYAQASYKIEKHHLKLVAGGRFDDNQVRESGGFGSVFNPRLGAIWSPGKAVFKLIYAEAFQDASNFQRFVVVAGATEKTAPDLQPESIENLELSASYRFSDRLEADISLYDSHYNNVAQLIRVPCDAAAGDTCIGTTQQFNNLGAQEIQGVQANVEWTIERWSIFDRLSIFGNYTFTRPYNTEPVDEDGNPRPDIDRLRIADIAEHQINLGAAAALLGDRLDVDLRLNWVDDKPTGPGTTVPTNPNTKIDGYVVTHAALTWKDFRFGGGKDDGSNAAVGISLQLAIQNLFDVDYEHPGFRDSSGIFAASSSPQPGRSFYLRASLKY